MTTPGGSTETTYTYEGLTPPSMSTSSQAGTTTLTYLQDESGRPYAALYRSPSTTSTVLFGIVTTDRGDVVELVDAESSPFAAYAYDAYGNPTGMPTQGTGLIGAALASEIADAQPLRYAGYCFDAFSGLYYLSARYYDPASAQFISKDPAKADGEESAYQYCGGGPVGAADPSGLCTFLWVMRARTRWVSRWYGWQTTDWESVLDLTWWGDAPHWVIGLFPQLKEGFSFPLRLYQQMQWRHHWAIQEKIYEKYERWRSCQYRAAHVVHPTRFFVRRVEYPMGWFRKVLVASWYRKRWKYNLRAPVVGQAWQGYSSPSSWQPVPGSFRGDCIRG